MSFAARAGSPRHRLALTLVAVVVAASGCDPATPGASAPSETTTDRAPTATGTPSTAPTATPQSPPGASPTPSTTPPAPGDLPALLADPALAAGAEAAELDAALADLVAGADGLVVGDRRREVAAAVADGPVVVGDVLLDAEHVSADLAVLVRDPGEQVVLRLLAASDGVPTAGRLQVRARADGRELDVAVEPALDRVVVALDGRDAGDPLVLGLEVDYPVPDREDLQATSGPAGYGLLADHGDVVTLGHWLPAIVAVPGNDGDVPPWGDLGAFDAGTWVVRVHHPDATLRTGGVDTPCPPTRAPACTTSVGLGLRDLAAVLFAERRPTATAPLAGVAGATVVATSTLAGDEAVATASAAQLDWLAATWGPVSWPEFDVVAAEISPAAGMEFPGLVLVDPSMWDPEDPTGEFVLVHEWAHQHFHAWVGNGSLSDPVVDESLAQYASWRWYRDRGGPGAAAAVARAAFGPDPDDAGEDGSPAPQPPGLAAGEFRDGDAYTDAIYRTAARAWVAAAEEHGLDTVDAVIAALVDRHGLAEVDQEALLAVAADVAPAVADDLRAAFSGVSPPP